MREQGRRWWQIGGRGELQPPNRPTTGNQPNPSATTEEFGSAIDLVARMLRVMGEVPVLPDEPSAAQVRGDWESWAQHILLLTPPPGSTKATPQRGWAALAHYLTE